jgi:hypothetical protein
MEPLNSKRARLRDELQQAYDAWMEERERTATERTLVGPVDVTGEPIRRTGYWLAYLAAKQRLVLAYAEQQPLAA